MKCSNVVYSWFTVFGPITPFYVSNYTEQYNLELCINIRIVVLSTVVAYLYYRISIIVTERK